MQRLKEERSWVSQAERHSSMKNSRKHWQEWFWPMTLFYFLYFLEIMKGIPWRNETGWNDLGKTTYWWKDETAVSQEHVSREQGRDPEGHIRYSKAWTGKAKAGAWSWWQEDLSSLWDRILLFLWADIWNKEALNLKTVLAIFHFILLCMRRKVVRFSCCPYAVSPQPD